MISWFTQLNSREKTIVTSASIVLVLLLIFLLVIEPIQKSNQNAYNKLESEKVLLEYMSKSASQLVAQGKLIKRNIVNNNTTPYILVDRNIRRFGFASPDRMSPQGQKGISFRYKNVNFDKLMQLIQQLEKNGLVLKQLSTTKTANGMVNARVKMEKNHD